MAKAKATSRTQRPRASGMNGRTAHVRVSTRAEPGRGNRMYALRATGKRRQGRGGASRAGRPRDMR